jgi:AcrR family transcriptional regulator
VDIKATPKRGTVRDNILRTALHLFTTRGYFNTSVHDIQGQAGVSIGSIYNHFGGKEGIARALYVDLVERMNAFVDVAFEADPDTHNRCKALVRGLFELTESDPETVNFVLNAKHKEFLPEEPPICSSEPFVRMREILHGGIEAGEIKSMDPMVVASCVYGPALRMISLRLDGLIDEPLPSFTDAIWEASWRAVNNKELEQIA